MTDATAPRTFPPGVSNWLDLETTEPDAAVAFYTELFGWTLDNAMPPEAPGHYFIATLEGRDVAAIASGAAALQSVSRWNTYFAVDDADATVAAVERAGGTIAAAPEDNPGGRAAACVDLEGAPFRLWQAGRRLGAQVTNRPGSWNFSDLHTADPAAAFAFYSVVFPWRMQDLGQDAEAVIQVPGYGDHLEATTDPDIRRRQAGAPAGFADAIGAIRPLAPGTEPHWHVTFTVGDRDSAVRIVERSGGTVLGLRETGWARLADIRDPGGALLTLSEYAPQR